MSDQVGKTAQVEVPSLEATLKANADVYGQGKTLPALTSPNNLLSLLTSGTGLDEWNVTPTYPTRQCTTCHEIRGVQHFVRSALPHGRLETNRAGCNTCKFKGLNNGLTREEFSRMYLGFEGVWDVGVDEEFYAGLCPGFWVPKKEKKFYAGTSAKLWSGHTDELVQAKLDAKFGSS